MLHRHTLVESLTYHSLACCVPQTLVASLRLSPPPGPPRHRDTCGGKAAWRYGNTPRAEPLPQSLLGRRGSQGPGKLQPSPLKSYTTLYIQLSTSLSIFNLHYWGNNPKPKVPQAAEQTRGHRWAPEPCRLDCRGMQEMDCFKNYGPRLVIEYII